MVGRTALSGRLPVAAALLLAGCGLGGSSTASQAPAPAASAIDLASLDACTIVSADTATQLVGGPVSSVTQNTDGSTSFCVYASPRGTEGVAVFVEQLGGGDARQVIAAALDQKTSSAAKLVSVKGIGDAAGSKIGDHDAAVAFAKDQLFVVLTASAATQTGTALLPKLEAVARQVAAKL